MDGQYQESWINEAVVWQSGLFISLATRILQQLAGEVAERKTQRIDPAAPLFGENELLTFVGMSLARLLRPLKPSCASCCPGRTSGTPSIWRA